jgi:hypothetical protein
MKSKKTIALLIVLAIALLIIGCDPWDLIKHYG